LSAAIANCSSTVTAHEVDRADNRGGRGQDETGDAAEHQRGT
jgi:hypothetical protein